MIQTKVKISFGDIYDEIGHVPVIPISIPAMDEIQALAWAAHEKGTALADEAWGWPVRYEPQVQEPVPHSKLPFRPAVFSIGVYPIWFVAFTWEYGQEQAPTLLVEDENLVTVPPTMAYAWRDAPGYAIHSQLCDLVGPPCARLDVRLRRERRVPSGCERSPTRHLPQLASLMIIKSARRDVKCQAHCPMRCGLASFIL